MSSILTDLKSLEEGFVSKRSAFFGEHGITAIQLLGRFISATIE